MLDARSDFPLFAPPDRTDHRRQIRGRLHAARLVRDGGTLQIGIGQVGDALAHGLILRHRDNAEFREIVARLAPGPKHLAFLERARSTGPLCVSEMLVDAFLA